MLWLSLVYSTMLLALMSLSILGFSLIVLLLLLLIVRFIDDCRQYQWLQGKRAIEKITYVQDQWTITQKDGTQIKQLTLTGCVVSQIVVILYFKDTTKRQEKTVVLFSDAVEQGALRRLRCYCRKAKRSFSLQG